MKMVSTIALKNLKYYNSRNILTGIAIMLTTLLLFLVPTIGMDMVGAQFAVIDEIYPRYHALFRGVDSETAVKLAAHHDIAVSGLRADIGIWDSLNLDVSMMYMDEAGFDLYHMQLEEGSLPQEEQEIVVSKKLLQAAGLQGVLGDTILVSYQLVSEEGFGYVEEKEFVISGFYQDQSEGATSFSSFVSKQFMERNVPENLLRYRFLFQVKGEKDATTDDLESVINSIAGQFGINEQEVGINNEYLAAHYVDPSTVPVIAGIMLIIVVAGIITIYSIYYVGMAERVREYGRMKAIGATDRQLRQMVLREGFGTALFAIPAGLLLGTLLVKTILTIFVKLYSDDQNIMMATARQWLTENKVPLYHASLYLLAVVVSAATVYVSLRKPMKMAAKVSEVEAMRSQLDNSNGKRQRKVRKSYRELNITKVSRIYLTSNKKNSVVTIISMGITGVLFMAIATILSCANPVESANNSIMGQYEISNNIEFGNKEHPEYEWSYVKQNNLMDASMRQRLEAIEGVTDVVAVSMCYMTADCIEGDKEGISGIPKEWKEELLDGVIAGKVTYEELQTGEKVIVNRNLLYWFPDIKVGDRLELNLLDGSEKTITVEVAAIGDYPYALSYGYFMMAQEGVEQISAGGNNTLAYVIYTDKKQEKAAGEEIELLLQEYSDRLKLRSWQQEYETWKAALSLTSGACYAFFIVLGLICIMNIINTMINNVHMRKKDIGMMQAIGMSDRQLTGLLQRESLFYTVGTLLLSICGGSLLGYPVFLWARDQGMFNISEYHYPVAAAVLLVAILFVIQLLLSLLLGHSVKKESLIERVRFSE